MLAGLVWAARDAGDAATAKAVQRVLDEHEALHRAMKEARQDQGLKPEELEAMAQKMKAMDLRECPADFAEAFIRLAGHHQKMAYLLKRHSGTTRLFFEMGFRLLSGEKDAGTAKILDAQHEAIEEALALQTEVEALAVRYGARLRE